MVPDSEIASGVFRRGVLLPVLLLSCAAWFGCGSPSAESDTATDPPFIEVGDLDEIVERGTLRVLVPTIEGKRYLPRTGNLLDDERDLVREFAEQLGVDTFWVRVDARSELIPRLLEGDADLVAANLTNTPERRADVDFTHPLMRVREQVVTRRHDTKIAGPADLEGRRVAVRRSSSYWSTLQELRVTYPGIEIQEVPEHFDTDEILHRVATRRLDVAIADSNIINNALAYRDDLRVACDLTDDETAIAWAVRPGSKKLLDRLNRFLFDAQLTRGRDESHTDDLSGLKERKALRLITPNSPATYFLWRGRLMGFEYELARRFARREGMRLEVIVPRRGQDMLGMLARGEGDLVGAALTEDRLVRNGVASSRPYNFVSQVVVARSGENGLSDIDDLAHRTVHVRHDSTQWRTLRELRAGGIPLSLQVAPERLEPEEIIGLVADGTYDLTVADSHVLDIELRWRDGVDAAFPLGEPMANHWAVRDANPELLAAIDAFFDQEYRGEFYNVIYSRYFKYPKKFRHHLRHEGTGDGLSPYDDVIRRYADRYGFDWRLIVAQMHQESGFDPQARSFAGAIGLLQVHPRAAEQMGYTDLEDPETNIHAGIEYLAWVYEHFEDDLPVRDRMWFSLAGYNVGRGHVRDARRLAGEMGLNPDRWFDNVEKAMLRLSRPEYAHVREIRARFETYLDTLAAL